MRRVTLTKSDTIDQHMVFKTNTIKISATTKVINYSAFNEHIFSLFQPTGSQQFNLFNCTTELLCSTIYLSNIVSVNTVIPKNISHLNCRYTVPRVDKAHKVLTATLLLLQKTFYQTGDLLSRSARQSLAQLKFLEII